MTAGASSDSSRPSIARELLHESLPGAPHVLARILELSDADADRRELLSLVETDPALTARVLRTANSPFFGQARTVITVEQAVFVLGFDMVRNLTLGLTIWDTASSQIPTAPLVRLWEHSIAVAVAARELAARSSLGDPGLAFTAGLLHDTGKLILARAFPDAHGAILTDRASASVDIERRALGCDHAAVGGWLFDSWRMPPPLVQAVARHHDATVAPGVAALVSVANLLVPGDEARTSIPHEAMLERAESVGVGRQLWEDVAARLTDLAAAF